MKTNSFILALLCVFPALSLGQSANLEETLLTQSGLESWSFTDAMLLASGANTRAELTRASQELKTVVNGLVQEVRAKKQDAAGQSEALLRAMHTGPLKRYQSGVFDLRDTLRSGDYNCLTSTALYLICANDLGLIVKAYAMRGHVLALLFLPDGPRFVETTNPDVPMEKKWSTPAWERLSAIERGTKAVDPVMKKLRKQAEDLQLLGMEQEADDVLNRINKINDMIGQTAKQWADELSQSAFEVDVGSLASLFFWNRAIDAALKRDTEQAVKAFTFSLAIGSKLWSSKAVGVRMFHLRTVLGDVVKKEGWENAIKTLNLMIKINKNAQEELLLRDLRAQIFYEWFYQVDPKNQCQVMKAAKDEDSAHPAVQLLLEESKSLGCVGPQQNR